MNPKRLSWAECLVAGVVLFGLVGLGGTLAAVVGMVWVVRSEWLGRGDFDPTVLACAATAASAVGAVSWRWVVATADARPRRGALAGLLVGVAAHPVCWALVTAVLIARTPAARPRSPADLAFSLVFMTALASFSSLALLGPVTATLGAAIGYAALRVRTRKRGREPLS